MSSVLTRMKLFKGRYVKSGIAAGMLVLSMGVSGGSANDAAGQILQPVAVPTGTDGAKPAVAPGVRSKVRKWFEVGQASWYGLKFQGRKTANGESFDMNGLTCAHRSLPMGSWVRVTNMKNRRSIFVRVNDRGPVPDNRVVDLSFAAARAVGLAGIGRVKLEPVRGSDVEMQRALVAQLHMPTPMSAGF